MYRVARRKSKAMLFEDETGRGKQNPSQAPPPPSLKVIFPKSDQVINQEAIWVDGESDLQANVYVNGKKIVKDSKGRFKQKVPLKKGVNLILVESIDPAGNVSFQRRVISRKF